MRLWYIPEGLQLMSVPRTGCFLQVLAVHLTLKQTPVPEAPPCEVILLVIHTRQLTAVQQLRPYWATARPFDSYPKLQ